MKRIPLILFMLVGNIPWGPIPEAMADDAAMAATLPDIPHTILGGVVRSVSWEDPARGKKSEIVVADATGNKINIYVMATTTLWDKDAKAIMPDGIVPKAHVNIIYLTTPEGINVGKSIKILK